MRKSFNFTPLILTLLLLLSAPGCQDASSPPERLAKQNPKALKNPPKVSSATSPLVVQPDSHEELRRIFALTPGNSDREKYVFWAVLALWTLGGVGKMTGLFTPDPELWKALSGIILLQAGRLWGRESERLRLE